MVSTEISSGSAHGTSNCFAELPNAVQSRLFRADSLTKRTDVRGEKQPDVRPDLSSISLNPKEA